MRLNTLLPQKPSTLPVVSRMVQPLPQPAMYAIGGLLGGGGVVGEGVV